MIDGICFLCCELCSTGKLQAQLELLGPIKPKWPQQHKYKKWVLRHSFTTRYNKLCKYRRLAPKVEQIPLNEIAAEVTELTIWKLRIHKEFISQIYKRNYVRVYIVGLQIAQFL